VPLHLPAKHSQPLDFNILKTPKGSAGPWHWRPSQYEDYKASLKSLKKE